jgi:3'(2'), 5'-bisphosphate nucleotidase
MAACGTSGEPGHLASPAPRPTSEAILEVYATAFDVTHKADKSPLTQADLAAHRLLSTALADMQPAYPVLSEESQAIDFAERSAWTTYWLVDPLDGTREFVKRNDEFTVNVALVHRGEPILGVVHAPALALTYFGYRDGGAWRARGDSPGEPIRAAPRVRDPIRVAGSRSHAGDSLQRFLAALGPHELVSMGSSLKLCLVADGSVDVYPRFGPTSEWDTAAAQCVVEQAGGRVTDTRLRTLRYNAGESLLNPEFLVFADDSKDWLACLSG